MKTKRLKKNSRKKSLSKVKLAPGALEDLRRMALKYLPSPEMLEMDKKISRYAEEVPLSTSTASIFKGALYMLAGLAEVKHEPEPGAKAVTPEELRAFGERLMVEGFAVKASELASEFALKPKPEKAPTESLRLQRAGEIGFGGRRIFYCPKHGDVLSCACSPKL